MMGVLWLLVTKVLKPRCQVCSASTKPICSPCMTNMKTTSTRVKRSIRDNPGFFCPSAPVLGAEKDESSAAKKPLPGALPGAVDFPVFVVGDVDFAVVGD